MPKTFSNSEITAMPESAAEEGYDPAWLELEAALGGRKHLEGSIPEKRAQFNGLAGALQQLWPPVEGLTVEDKSIPAPQTSNSKEVALRVYRPAAPAASELPTVVWFHGGGWMCGSLDSEDAQCRRVAAGLPCTVVSVGYGTIPENSTAGMLADCLAGFDWARERAGGDPERMVAMGGSAGGALAFSTVYGLGRLGREKEVKGVVGMFPVTVHSEKPPERYAGLYQSYRELEMTAPIVRGPDQLEVLEASAELSPEDPLLAVKFSYDEPALKKFPRTYIVTAQKDLMRDDGVVLEAALQNAGVPVKRDHYMGLPHYFWFFPQLKKTEPCVVKTIEGLRWVLKNDGEGGLAVHDI